jgi:hypothetical protein
MPAKAATKAEAPKKSSTAEPTLKAALVAVAKQEPTPKPASKAKAKVEVNQENDADDEEEETNREHNTKKLEYYNIKFKEYQAKLTAIADKIEYYKSLLE